MDSTNLCDASSSQTSLVFEEIIPIFQLGNGKILSLTRAIFEQPRPAFHIMKLCLPDYHDRRNIWLCTRILSWLYSIIKNHQNTDYHPEEMGVSSFGYIYIYCMPRFQIWYVPYWKRCVYVRYRLYRPWYLIFWHSWPDTQRLVSMIMVFVGALAHNCHGAKQRHQDSNNQHNAGGINDYNSWHHITHISHCNDLTNFLGQKSGCRQLIDFSASGRFVFSHR